MNKMFWWCQTTCSHKSVRDDEHFDFGICKNPSNCSTMPKLWVITDVTSSFSHCRFDSNLHMHISNFQQENTLGPICFERVQPWLNMTKLESLHVQKSDCDSMGLVAKTLSRQPLFVKDKQTRILTCQCEEFACCFILVESGLWWTWWVFVGPIKKMFLFLVKGCWQTEVTSVHSQPIKNQSSRSQQNSACKRSVHIRWLSVNNALELVMRLKEFHLRTKKEKRARKKNNEADTCFFIERMKVGRVV